MPGYVIANYTINDSEAFEKYPPMVGPTIDQHSGRVLVADQGVQSVEGGPRQVIVVLEFESAEAARRWYDSPEYASIKELRTSNTEGWLAIAEGFVPPES